DRNDNRIKYITTGLFMRQHDPDFIDGNTYSVFDNIAIDRAGQRQSRIVRVTAPANTLITSYRNWLAG
ncbi:MAG: hypothetical protein ABIH03_11235, partial [Pseudomonadota bacterium]